MTSLLLWEQSTLKLGRRAILLTKLRAQSCTVVYTCSSSLLVAEAKEQLVPFNIMQHNLKFVLSQSNHFPLEVPFFLDGTLDFVTSS